MLVAVSVSVESLTTFVRRLQSGTLTMHGKKSTSQDRRSFVKVLFLVRTLFLQALSNTVVLRWLVQTLHRQKITMLYHIRLLILPGLPSHTHPHTLGLGPDFLCLVVCVFTFFVIFFRYDSML